MPPPAAGRVRGGAGRGRCRRDHRAPASVAAGERRVERGARWRGQQLANELQRLRGTDQANHACYLPPDGDRAVITDGIERPEAVLPRHIAVTGRDEVPPAPPVGPGQVRREPAAATVADAYLGVLAVDVVDPVGEV